MSLFQQILSQRNTPKPKPIVSNKENTTLWEEMIGNQESDKDESSIFTGLQTSPQNKIQPQTQPTTPAKGILRKKITKQKERFNIADYNKKKRLSQYKQSIPKRKRRKLELGDIEFVKIEPPVRCKLRGTYRRFSISFYYKVKGDSTAKVQKKTINFGHIHKREFIDTQDKIARSMLMTRIRNYDSPFKSNFWRVYLLNTLPSMMDSYVKIVKAYGLDQ